MNNPVFQAGEVAGGSLAQMYSTKGILYNCSCGIQNANAAMSAFWQHFKCHTHFVCTLRTVAVKIFFLS